MINRIFAPLSLILLIAFMAIIVFFIKGTQAKVELILISALCCGLAVYDFWKWFKEGGEEEENASISQPETSIDGKAP